MVTGSHWEPQLWKPSFASRALPGRHMFASQLAMGKSFTASGAILATPVTRGHPVEMEVLQSRNMDQISNFSWN